MIFCVWFSSLAQAEYRLGYSLGYGGTGITSKETYESISLKTKRSEQPGVVGFSYEFLTSDRTSFALTANRGFSISPFSSGVGFYGATWRWFYFENAPSVTVSKNERSFLLVTKRVPFFGLGTGIAAGSITRINDVIPTVSATGVYIGFHGGYDIQTQPGQFLRTEIIYATTPPSSGLVDSSLTEFAILFGWYFLY